MVDCIRFVGTRAFAGNFPVNNVSGKDFGLQIIPPEVIEAEKLYMKPTDNFPRGDEDIHESKVEYFSTPRFKIQDYKRLFL